MATHSSLLARRIPRTEEPGRPQSTELQRAQHSLATQLQKLNNNNTFRTSHASQLRAGGRQRPALLPGRPEEPPRTRGTMLLPPLCAPRLSFGREQSSSLEVKYLPKGVWRKTTP